ncbi:shikimate dehydrogenase [Promicromonospora sp. MEB111]|uniref:shikimate dehydrogenase n=1 Tax=Promicromonospora sp. MEB111 TaxID=3040301 RepID=UPI00254FB311|nr:shikimate dehydrogenase [Promicromonospora sp. MEB111]
MTRPARRYRVALLGNGIRASLSPALHMEEARHLGLDYEYRTVDLIDRTAVDLGAELGRLEDAGYAATNVTHPYKQTVLDHVTDLSPTVRRLGSANLVLFGAGRRTAHNTDCPGFRGALATFLAAGGAAGTVLPTGTVLRTGTVLQVGAGGAGLATVAALLDLGFRTVVVHDAVPAAVATLLDRFAPVTSPRLLPSGGTLDTWLPRVDGVVHVTPVGMAEHPGVAFEVDRLDPAAWVAEVVYRPLETELLRRARARGLATLDGGGMAVGQAVESLRLITGLEPDTARMHAHFRRLVAGPDTLAGPDPLEA